MGMAVLAFAGPVFAQSAAKGKSYDLRLVYENSVLLVSEINLKDYAARDHRVQPESGWRCDVVSIDGAPLYSFNFIIPATSCRDQTDASGQPQGACAKQDKADFVLSVPYYDAGAAINIYDPDGVQVISADTIKMANLCGDNVCESGENYLTCAKDCRSGVKDGVCDGVKDGVCDFDCEAAKDSDCAAANSGILWLVAALLVAAGLIGGGFVFWRKKRETEE